MTILVLSTGAIVASLFSAQCLAIYMVPRSWLHWLIDATPQRAKGALLRRLARQLAPYMPAPEIVLAEVVEPKRWKTPSCRKTVNTTAPIHTAQTVDLTPVVKPITAVVPPSKRAADTIANTRHLPRTIAPVAQIKPLPKPPAPPVNAPASRLDAATLALDDSGLCDLLKVMGAKVPAPSTRENLLSAVEAAIYRPTRKIKA